MRKRTINHLSDTVLWYFIYLFPLLVVLVMSIRAGETISLSEFFTTNGYNILSSGIVFDSLNALFGSSGILPLFGENSGLIYYASWFTSCMLIHLAVDFLLFIPRMAHRFMNKFTEGD